MSKYDRYSYSEQSDNSEGECLLGMTGPIAMNVYWSLGIFTSDLTSGPVGSSVPAHTSYNVQIQRQKLVHCRSLLPHLTLLAHSRSVIFHTPLFCKPLALTH